MHIYNSKISKFPSAVSTISETVILFEELMNIREGKYKNEILNCRKHLIDGDRLGYKKNKTFLPAITFSGEFIGSHKKENLKTYSQFIVIDLDGLDRIELESIKEGLFKDPFVAAIWISPSGCGLKVLIGITSTPDDHKKCFDQLSLYLNVNHKVEVDKSGSDICRLCFVSFDEKLLIKEEMNLFNYMDFYSLESIENVQKVKKVEGKIENGQYSSPSEKVRFYGTKGKNKQFNRATIIKIITFLKKKNLSITDNYNDWFRVACAIANTFTFDLGQKYYLEICRIDGPLHDEYKSQQLLEYCYRNHKDGEIKFPTIVFLAKQKGFIIV